MRIAVEARTDVGLVRELNEDSYRILPEQKAVVVCDGMGGHAAGEVASATAADTISDLVQGDTGLDPVQLSGTLGGDWPPEAARLAWAVRLANRRLYNEASRSHKLRGMGTTVVAALFRPGSIITAHVGDSRAYRVTPDQIEQLTVDHSWIAELLESGQVRPEDVEHFADKNVITRALGTRPGVQVDLGIHPVAEGEIYLLCSDGLCGYVSDPEILRCVNEHRSDLNAAAEALIQAANAAGGLDNSTVALVRIDEAGTVASGGVESVTLPEETEEDLVRLDQILLGRYKEDGAASEEHTDGHLAATSAAGAGTSASRRGWQWLLLAALLAALLAVWWWPRQSDQEPPNSQESSLVVPDQAVRPSQSSPDSLALLFVAAGSADRTATAYLDGIAQGSLTDLEFGLLVEPGPHLLVVIDSLGDTLFTRRLELEPSDTMDLVVR